MITAPQWYSTAPVIKRAPEELRIWRAESDAREEREHERAHYAGQLERDQARAFDDVQTSDGT